MASSRLWANAYARQAESDWRMCNLLRDAKGTPVPLCQYLHFLQMACEKLCKATLYQNSSPSEAVQTSHAYCQTVLPIIIRMKFSEQFDRKLGNRAQILARFRQYSREIDLLAPAVDDNGKRNDNCEYPWEDSSGNVISPLDFQFPNLDFLKNPHGRLFLKLIAEAIDSLPK